MWLPTLADALTAGEVDVAITCGTLAAHPGVSSEAFVAEELLVGLRATHRLAAQETVMLSQLCHDLLGVPPAALFPAWASSVHNALDEAGVAPPTRELPGTDLAGARWAEGEEIDWVLLISSVSPKDEAVVVLPVSPTQLVPFTVQPPLEPGSRTDDGRRPLRPHRAVQCLAARLAHPSRTPPS
jgi:DNA-binding transcriptional LysR family regulator